MGCNQEIQLVPQDAPLYTVNLIIRAHWNASVAGTKLPHNASTRAFKNPFFGNRKP